MKLYINLFILFIFSVAVNAQGGFPEKYRAAHIGFGPRTLNTEKGTIITTFIDESPSMDKLISTTEVEDKYNKFGFQVGYIWGKYRGLSHSLIFDISLGEHQGGLFTYSLGYNIPFEVSDNALVIRPALVLGFGNFGFDIGKLQNNAGYIEINGNKYFDNYLETKLKSQVFVYGPELDFMFFMGDHFLMSLAVNYDLTSKNDRPEVTFTPPNDNTNSPGETSVKIDGDNPLVTYNGSRLTTLPYDVSGLRLTLGVSYVWNYD